MSQLFRRSWKLQVDTLDVSALDIEFDVLKTIKPLPNKCVVTLWNVNKSHRAQLLLRNKPNPASNNVVGIPIELFAGYGSKPQRLFRGDLREVGGGKEVGDRKMVISGDDGGRAARESRINRTFNKGTKLSTVFKACADSLGLGLGNITQNDSNISIDSMGDTLQHSMTLSGNASAALTRVVNSIGLTWSVQDGAIQILDKGIPLDQSAIEISSDTGLIDSPQASIDSTTSLGNAQQFAATALVKKKLPKPPKPKDTGILKLKTLLIPGMAPGRKISLKSDNYTGGYMLVECRYVGKSWAKDWYIESVARIY